MRAACRKGRRRRRASKEEILQQVECIDDLSSDLAIAVSVTCRKARRLEPAQETEVQECDGIGKSCGDYTIAIAVAPQEGRALGDSGHEKLDVV